VLVFTFDLVCVAQFWNTPNAAPTSKCGAVVSAIPECLERHQRT